jgi:hypothetical protein
MPLMLPVGTKSLLFGVHCWFIHPFAVAYAWWRLYGFPRDPRLWVAFLVHDWGYWGCRNMDGFDGKLHPQTGGAIMRRLFGDEWGDLCEYHSRHYARMMRREPSKLCAPDKLASTVLPAWLYLTLATLSGEIAEYTSPSNAAVLQARTGIAVIDRRSWYRALRAYLEQETRRTAAA